MDISLPFSGERATLTAPTGLPRSCTTAAVTMPPDTHDTRHHGVVRPLMHQRRESSDKTTWEMD